MNRRVGGGAAVALLLIVIVVVLARRSVVTPVHDPAAPNVATAVAEAGSFASRVSAQGRVGSPAGSTAKLAFAQSGILRAIDVRVGERVTAGTILAELDRSSLGATLAQSAADARAAAAQFGAGAVGSAAIHSAQARLELAQTRVRALDAGGPAAQSDEIAAQETLRQAQLKVQSDIAAIARDQTLLAGGVIAQKDLDAARTALSSDSADQRAAEGKLAAARAAYATSVRQARADAAGARNDLVAARATQLVAGAQTTSAEAKRSAATIAFEQGVLRAPQDGVVLAILKHPGEAIDPSSAAIELGAGSAQSITLAVPAATAQRIEVGDSVRIAMAGAASRTSGRVIAVVPAVDPSTQSATVTVSGAPIGAIPGTAIAADIVVAQTSGIVVPSSAIVEDPQTGRTIVFVRKGDGSFAMRRVTVFDSDDRTALLRSGLRTGERVATQGAYELLAPSGG